LISGTVFAVVILAPLSSVNLMDFQDFKEESLSPELYVDLGKDTARKAYELRIKEACESYISNKANELGLTVLTEVHLSKTMEPDFVKIYGHAEAECQDQLEIILEDDLGITKENQVWMWNPGEKSS
jgi:hypothetical protein